MTRRVVVAGTAVAVVAMAIAFYFLSWSPGATKLQTARTQLAAAQAAEVPLRSQVASLSQLHAKLPALRKELSRLQAALPATPQLATTIDQLNATARRAGVSLESLAPTPVTPSSPGSGPTSPLQTVSMSIAVRGTYYQVMNYLYYLSRMPRLITVDTVSLSSGDGGGSLNAQLSARMFYVAAGTGGAGS